MVTTISLSGVGQHSLDVNSDIFDRGDLKNMGIAVVSLLIVHYKLELQQITVKSPKYFRLQAAILDFNGW